MPQKIYEQIRRKPWRITSFDQQAKMLILQWVKVYHFNYAIRKVDGAKYTNVMLYFDPLEDQHLCLLIERSNSPGFSSFLLGCCNVYHFDFLLLLSLSSKLCDSCLTWLKMNLTRCRRHGHHRQDYFASYFVRIL